MITRIHLTSQEADLYKTNEFYRNSVNRVAIDIITRHEIIVDIACLQYQEVLAVFKPIEGKVSRPSTAPPPASNRTLSGTADTQIDLQPPGNMHQSYYQHSNPSLQANEPSGKGYRRSDTLKSNEVIKDPPPSFATEKVDVGKVKLRKRSHQDKGSK